MEYMTQEEMNNTSKQICKWYRKDKNKILSILTVPFNTTLIFSDLILELVQTNQKILYVWGRESEDRVLIDYLRKTNRNISFVSNKSSVTGYKISFIHYDLIDKINEKYNVVIFDDISYFSELGNNRVKEKVNKLENIGDKVITYTVESIIDYGEKLDVIPVNHKFPFVEPRILNTRIDLKKDIPFILYEYLVWFAENKRKIIIFVPDQDKLNSVYQYYTKKLRMKRIKIIPLVKNEETIIVQNVLKNTNEATIIITDSMEERLVNSNIGNAVVLFADDEGYNYKKLLYLCGEMGRINDYLPEVLLVSKETTDNLEKVKSITREFNKKKWENSLKL